MSPSNVAGNATDDVKEQALYLLEYIMTQSTFARDVQSHIKLTEVSVKKQEGRKEQATVICEIVTGEEMLNGFGTMHGGCIAYLIDTCTSIPLMVISDAGDLNSGGVSQTLNVIYHSPASLGSRLRIVSTIVSRGRRAATLQCEIWDTAKNTIVASGTHIKMAPSIPKSKL